MVVDSLRPRLVRALACSLRRTHPASGSPASCAGARCCTGSGSFNGATPFQAWRQWVPAGGDNKAIELQWGHALPGVETWCTRNVARMAFDPLQWGHALPGVETSDHEPGL